jgi:hypothetical protein
MHEHEEYLIHGDGYTFCLFPGCDYEQFEPVGTAEFKQSDLEGLHSGPLSGFHGFI